jgi:radical SAM superfamily enzyme YgiQ (UPF0313 family)
MRIYLLDVYPDRDARISKDTNGGFGTVNDYGNGLLTRALTKRVNTDISWPPIELMYVASVLTKQGHSVLLSNEKEIVGGADDIFIIMSSIVAHETEVDLIERLHESGRRKLVAIGSFARAIPLPYITAGAWVVLSESDLYFTEKQITTIDFAGEACYLSSDGVLALDELPFPAFDLNNGLEKMNFSLYGKRTPVIPLLATRGCPYSCYEYCVYPFAQGRKVRHRSPENIIEEMRYWKNMHGVSYFIFRDPVFSIDRRHTLEFARKLVEQNLGVKFLIETHLRNLDEEVVEALWQAGLHMVKFGVESGSDQVLESGKRKNPAIIEQKETINRLHARSIETVAHYIIGLPAESREDFKKTINLSLYLNTTFAQLSVFTPYPGTPRWKEYEARLTTEKFSDFTQYRLVFDHPKLSYGDVEKLKESFYRRFYLRIGWLVQYFLRKISPT